MKKGLLFILFLCMGISMVFAQERQISGVIREKSTNEPLPGVSVVEKGTTNGTITDIDGKFILAVKANATLKVSFIGMEPQEVLVGSASTYNLFLEPSSEELSEVVVVGYGTMKKENLTGSVVSVDINKTLSSRPVADIGRGLQGAVPGLSVRIPTGEIGSDPIMKIRGQIASISGSSSPLILMDNVEIPSIQMINPDDVESITVLKDAAASSIYGSKAAFGVVLITTKKGSKTDAVQVTYSGNFSWQNRAKDLNMAGIDGLQYTWDAAISRNPENPTTTPTGNMWKISDESIKRAKEWIEKYGGTVSASDPVVYNRDWYVDENGRKMGVRLYNSIDAMVAEWTPTQTHNISVGGKKDGTSYNIGLGMIDQTGMTKPAKEDDFRRYNASLKLSTEVNQYLTLRAGAMYSDRVKRYPSLGTTTADPWLYAYRWGPLMPVGVKDQQENNIRNPAYELAETNTAKLRYVYTNINLGATVNFSKDWNLEFDYTFYTQENIREKSIPTFTAGDAWYSPVLWKNEEGNQVYVDDDGNITSDGGVPAYRFNQITYNGNGTSGSLISRSSRRANNHVLNIYSTYNLRLGEMHALKFMVGMNRVTNDWNEHYGERTDLIDYSNPQFNFATGIQSVNGDANWQGQVGFFERINYAFNDKYLLEANLRYDGSSKFPSDLRWQWFPSFSAGWVLSSENFMKIAQPVLSFAKFRTSWGSIGDQTISNSLYVPTLSDVETKWLDANGKRPGFHTPAAVSRDISWQRIQTLDFGTDLRFWENKLGLTFDWYQRDTKDMIVAGDALPYTYGVAAPNGNYGNLRTRGWEIAIDYAHRFRNGLGINAMATLSNAVTRTTKGADYKTPWENRSIGNSFATGARYGDIWGYRSDRLYQEDDFVRGEDGKLMKTTIIIDGVAKQSYMLSGQNPAYQTYLEDGGGVVIFRPGDVKFIDLDGDGYITPGEGTFGDPGDREVIGNSTPQYEYGFRFGADYKGFDASIFVQGVGKRKIWGSGQLAIPGYNSADGAMPQAIAGNYWREDRTDAFYPRPWNNGSSNTNYSLQIQSRYLLNMAYMRIKNITVGYSVSPKLLQKAHLTKLRAYVSLENFFTFDKLRGLPIDPEAISGYSMFNTDNYNLGRTGTGTPTFKSVSVGVQLSL